LELFTDFSKPQRSKSWNKNWKMFGLRTKIAELRPQKHQGPLQKFKNPTMVGGKIDGSLQPTLAYDYRAFLGGDRQKKCLAADLQRTM